MTAIEKIHAIERLIQDDVGQRGLAAVPGNNLITHTQGDLLAAAQSIANHPAPRVLIVTGFIIATVDPPRGETDGPPGTLFLAHALATLGIPVTIASDVAGYDACKVGLSLYPNPSASVDIIHLPQVRDEATYREEFAATLSKITHLIALERSGPSALGDDLPIDQRNRNFSMRGFDITALTSPAHLLFEGARHYTTIGIGDGGNEIGMGKVPRATIATNIPNGALVACRIATDLLIVAGVSNWGGFALGAAVSLLKGISLADFFRQHQELPVLQAMNEQARMVDGVTRQQTPTVDGQGIDEYLKPYWAIAELLK